MNCENAAVLVPSYLDEELSEEQAAPLRKHLLACPGCRELAKDGTNLSRWFADDEPFEVPAGFAARVARRAFSGDRGLLPESASEGIGADLQPTAAAAGGKHQTPLLRFVLTATSIAALVLFVLAMAIRWRTLPEGRGVQAEDAIELRQQIEELNRRDAEALDSSGELSDQEQGAPGDREPTLGGAAQ